MTTANVKPLPKDAIQFVDQMLAKHLIVAELLQVPEFVALWDKARAAPAAVMESVKLKLQALFSTISPEGRGAFMLLGGEARHLYDETAIQEAQDVLSALESLSKAINQELERSGQKADYRAELETMVLPLGVPDLVDVMMIWDFERWGIRRLLLDSGPVKGPVVDLIESLLVRELFDLSPTEAAMATPGTIRRRARKKIAPIGPHLKKKRLRQRIKLWVRNVVYGETYEQIAKSLEADLERVSTGYSPYRWVERQVEEANRILGVRRQGRPRKVPVLEHWKMMAN